MFLELGGPPKEEHTIHLLKHYWYCVFIYVVVWFLNFVISFLQIISFILTQK